MFYFSNCLVFPVVVVVFFFTSCNENSGKFVKLSPDQTNIHFNNTIIENDSVNIFDFANIYNGGGVGIGDFNNDGLQDIYFTGNMVSNKLYLNKGNLKFEDVTTSSATEGKGVWSRGVAVVDINNDGKLDMYVCATAKRDPRERINILYVNQGTDKNNNPVFRDMANEYGLADTTQSTMAYFFDYDNDEDLDLFIAVNHIMKDEYTNAFRKPHVNGEHPSTSRLYRNDWNNDLQHPYFTDVSKSAGILKEGFTHAANIADFNNDGWMDIFEANDYISSNVLYINNHDGTFTDRAKDYFKHSAYNSMGSDVVDMNNDGLEDMIEVDMAPEDNFRKKMFQSPNNYLVYQNSDLYGYQYQYVRNMLHINEGPTIGYGDSIHHPVFSDLGYFAGIAETDWSWTPLAADFDNDGHRDILFTTGFPKDITDHDFIAYRKQASTLVTKKELLDEIPAVKIHNYIYRNDGNLRFQDKTNHWGMEEPGFSYGAAYTDLDNDGDLDIVINNINDPAMVYENRLVEKQKSNFLEIKFKGPTQNINGIGAKVVIHQNGGMQCFVNNPYRGYISSVSTVMHFGLGDKKVDSLEVYWPNGTRQLLKSPVVNTVLNVDIKNALPYVKTNLAIASGNWFTNITDGTGINYVHQQRDFIDFNIQKLLPHKLTEYAPGIAAGDVNGDGLDDFITGGSPNYSAMLFIQKKDGTFTQNSLMDSAGALQKKCDDRGVLLFDADGDSDLDLYISAGGYAYDPGDKGYSDCFFINDGKGNFSLDSTAMPVNTTSKFCVRSCDYDKDGDLDLFVAGRVKPWNYPQAVSSFIYRNDSKNGTIKFMDVTSSVASALNNVGLTCDAIWTDFDNDGWTDLLLAGEWMPLTFLKNHRGQFKEITTTGLNDKTGWWNSITSGDFDNDGDVDYVAANLGENSFYKANNSYPAAIYAKDFDQNGVLECIPTKYIKNKIGGELNEFTSQTRDDVVDQMPFIKRRFLTYKSFGEATFNDLFTAEQKNGMVKLQANYLQHAFVRNNGNGKFSLEPLPDRAQFSTINGMVSDDFDGDGNLDICMNTNDYSTEPGNGRYDGLNGLILKGDGKGGFTPLSILQSGIFIPGNGKGLAKLKGADGSYLLVSTQNRGPVQIFKNKTTAKLVAVAPADEYCIVDFGNGKKQKLELNYGSSFLSQGSRFISLAATAKKCTIVNNQGKSREADHVTNTIGYK